MANIEKTTDSQIVLTQMVCDIQHKLKAPKGQYNSFGQYKYRSCEDILEGVKPLLKEYNLLLIINDESKMFTAFTAVWIATIALIIAIEKLKLIKKP